MAAERETAATGADARPRVPGWRLPLLLGDDGAVPSTRGDAVADTARLVLEVVPGERPFLPEFGCRVHLLPVPATTAERQVMAALMEESLERWVPWLAAERVEVTAVEGRRIDVDLRAGGRWYRFAIAHRGRGTPAEGGGRPEHPVEGTDG